MRFCEGMILDVLDDRIPYQKANATMRAYGSMLRTADMNQKYGPVGQDGRKNMALVEGAPASGEVVNETLGGSRKT